MVQNLSFFLVIFANRERALIKMEKIFWLLENILWEIDYDYDDDESERASERVAEAFGRKKDIKVKKKKLCAC